MSPRLRAGDAGNYGAQTAYLAGREVDEPEVDLDEPADDELPEAIDGTLDEALGGAR